MKKSIKARTTGHPQEMITRQSHRRRAGGVPDFIAAADLLGRVYHKLTCFAALFVGDKEVIDQIDPAGAWIILTEILDEIEKAENLLGPA
jgi:hypothetical protein